jgi:hypothetical protein
MILLRQSRPGPSQSDGHGPTVTVTRRDARVTRDDRVERDSESDSRRP